MKITITGISGFVGQNLSTYLINKGCAINGLSLRTIDWKKSFVSNADALIHLAGKAHDTANTSADEEYFKINRDLTIALYDEFLQSDVMDFFYFSSVKAVADQVETILIEEVKAEPLTPYGKSKLEAENYMLSKPIPSGKRVFIIRPCMIHGPGNKGNLNLLYKVVEKGVPWPLARFDNQRSFLSIDNLSFMIYEMLRSSNLQSGVYNFADDDALSTNDLVRIIGSVLGKDVNLLKIPVGLVKSIVKIGDVLPLPLNSERLKKLTESYVVSNTKIKKALGIEKLPLSAKEGLENTIKSFNQAK
ncbi:NAD-dependent epimerase/dehydratase family protein [Sphingobacterium composti Ten et al. 2007 non Yoo et al. 2007]|uniref:NAD-dependent epimerase/dehydratase family protein n=1 Tax=Sphingobacterium composti TaxID=363260 RepID=UPI00135A2976|nr:NAD-dependent epimerase/dehydratase family protein [Sphingobacterium composti Ten et al. 2007 non Yoo et al. 2007]